jgi:hypothetical protein
MELSQEGWGRGEARGVLSLFSRVSKNNCEKATILYVMSVLPLLLLEIFP